MCAAFGLAGGKDCASSTIMYNVDAPTVANDVPQHAVHTTQLATAYLFSMLSVTHSRAVVSSFSLSRV